METLTRQIEKEKLVIQMMTVTQEPKANVSIIVIRFLLDLSYTLKIIVEPLQITYIW